MSQDRNFPAIPLFDQNANHSSVPTEIGVAIARSGGPGRPSGRRVSATPWTGASTMARLRSLGAIVCTVLTLVPPVLLSPVAAHAEPAALAMQPSRVKPVDRFAEIIAEASRRYGVPAHWLRAIMHIESAADFHARSRKGAMGLMQIMPETWTELRARHGFGGNPYDPHDNIFAGAAYIRELHDRFGAPGFLAAYNAGPGRYEKHLATGRPLPFETQRYVDILAPMIEDGRGKGRAIVIAGAQSWMTASLFFARTEIKPTVDPKPLSAQSNRQHPARAVDLSALVPQSDGLFTRRATGN